MSAIGILEIPGKSWEKSWEILDTHSFWEEILDTHSFWSGGNPGHPLFLAKILGWKP